MRKHLFLFMLLVATACGNAWATKVYATYGTPASEGKWDAETNTYTWTASYSNLMTIFEFAGGELADYTGIYLSTADYVDGPYRICFMNGSTAVATISFYSAGEKNLEFSQRDETKNLDLSQITHISFGGASGAGSIKLNQAYLVKPLALNYDETGVAYVGLTDIDCDVNLTFDDVTGEMTSEGQGTFTVALNNADFSNVSKVELVRSGDDIVQTLQITDADNGVLNTWYSSKYSCNFTDYQSKASKVTKLSWNCNKAGTMTIEAIKITSAVMVASSSHYTVVTKDMFHQWDGVGADANQTETTLYPAYDLNTSLGAGATIYGDPSVSYLNYSDLTGYDKLVIAGTPGTSLRVLLNRQTDGGALIELTPTFDSNGVAEVDLTAYEYAHLNAIKRPWDGGTATISSIQLYKENVSSPYDYIITGSGVPTASVTAALADATATIYDATGVTGSHLTLQAVNPNAIFVANDGVLNMDNVCVDGNIDFLRLTDGYPFAFPAGATVGTGAYFREQANEFGTICLPFGITKQGTKLYIPESISGDALVLQEVEEVAAGVPAIVWAEDKSFEFTGSGALAEAKTSNGTVQLTGSFAEEAIDVTAEPGTSYYGISNNTFVKATKTLTVKPFRAYLTTSAASAKDRLALQTEEATAISALTAEDANVEAVFNAAGARQNGLQKGLNIVKMNNGKTMKVVVK